jgi:hypothetical protein
MRYALLVPSQLKDEPHRLRTKALVYLVLLHETVSCTTEYELCS